MVRVRTMRGSSSTTRMNVMSRRLLSSSWLPPASSSGEWPGSSSPGPSPRWRQRKVYDDGQPAAWRVLSTQRAVHGFGEPASHGKSQAYAFTWFRVPESPEWGEDLFLRTVWDADPTVDHPDLEAVTDGAATHHDLLAPG